MMLPLLLLLRLLVLLLVLLLLLSRKAEEHSRSADQKLKDGQPTHSVLVPVTFFELLLYLLAGG